MRPGGEIARDWIRWYETAPSRGVDAAGSHRASGDRLQRQVLGKSLFWSASPNKEEAASRGRAGGL